MSFRDGFRLAAVLLAAACSLPAAPGEPAPSPSEPSPALANPTGVPTPVGPSSTGATPPALADGPLATAQELATADLALRLGVRPADIVVVAAEALTWPDGSLGCPQPDRFYTQALVDGYRVILGHADRVYIYHAGSDARPFLCPSAERDGGHDFVPPPGYDQ